MGNSEGKGPGNFPDREYIPGASRATEEWPPAERMPLSAANVSNSDIFVLCEITAGCWNCGAVDLIERIRLQNYLLWVEWDINLYLSIRFVVNAHYLLHVLNVCLLFRQS